MSFKSTALIARKSIRARFGRLIAISIAILVGVSFVVGSFVLADSLRQTFDDLFTQISQNVDLQVRSSVAFGEDNVDVQRDPIPAVARRPGRPGRRRRGDRAAAQPLRPTRRPGRRADRDAGRADARRGLDRRRVAVRARDQGRGHGRRRARPGGHRQGDRRPRGLRRRRHDPGHHRHRHAHVHDHRPRRARRQRRLRRRHAGGVGRRDGAAGDRGARPVRRRRRRRRRRASTRRRSPRSIEQILPERTEVVTARRPHRGEQAGPRHDHQRLRQRPAGVRLRHRLRQRLPHQQRVPDHDRSTAARAGADAGGRRVGPAGPAADLHRGARDGDHRHDPRHRRRHPRRQGRSSPSSTRPAPGSPTAAPCCCPGRS